MLKTRNDKESFVNEEQRIHVPGRGNDLFKYSEAGRRPLWLY